MKRAFLIDSSASISQDLKERDNVFVVGLSVTWGDKSYNDTTDENLMKQFYHQLSTSKILPTTSQPQPGEIIERFQSMIEQGFESVIIITLSANLSGTYSTIDLISQEFSQDINSYMVDSKGTSYLMERMLEIGLKLNREGKSTQEILETLEWFRDHGSIHVVIRNLQNLVKGGRLSSASAFLGSRLKIYPLLKFDDDGNIMVKAKVRTLGKVKKAYLDIVREAKRQFPAGFDVAFAHGDCIEDVDEFKQEILNEFPDIKFRVGYLTPVLGSHGGPGALGIGILPYIENRN